MSTNIIREKAKASAKPRKASGKAPAKTTTKPGTREILLSCMAPDASSVFVAGTFNNWNVGAAPMKRSKSGEWTLCLRVKPGHHEFKFIVDGEWCCRPGCAGNHACQDCVYNEHGTMNRVLEV